MTKAVAQDSIAIRINQMLLEMVGPIKPVRHDLVPPVLFPGVAPKRKHRSDPGNLGPYLALDSQEMAPFFAYANQLNCGIGFPGYAYLSELAQRSEYRAPTGTYADEMTRKWIKLVSTGEGDKSKQIAELTEDLEAYKVQRLCHELMLHDGFFGRAQLHIAIDGQEGDREQQLPLVIDPKTIKKNSLLGFKTIEPIWTTPYAYDSLDPRRPDFFRPRAWYIMGRRVHHTRLITIVSREVPDILKPAFNFGGLSMSQLIEPYVNRWLKTVQSVNDLIRNFSIIVLATDMAATLGGDKGNGLLDRVALFTQMRDNRGLMTLDKNAEDLKQVAVPLSGLSELQAQAQEHMAAPTHIPLVKLFGITPTGLNASAEGEIQVFYDYIHAQQENVLGDPLRIILNILQLNRYGKIDPTITAQFVPLDELTVKELAEVRKSDSEAGVAYITAGVIDADEERTRIAQDPNSGYNHLSGPAPEPPEPVGPDGLPLTPDDDDADKGGDGDEPKAPPKE